MSEIENFNFDEIFDENTVKVKKDFVDVKFILDKREQNAREKEERLKEKENAEANGEPPAKKQKSEKRGQNKKRTHTENKVPVSAKICKAFERGKCTYDDCKFSHDFEAVWSAREQPDLGCLLGRKCPIFENFGWCQYGFNCRFGETHIIRNKETGKLENIRNPEFSEEDVKVLEDYEFNRVNSNYTSMLRENRYPFPKSKAAMSEISAKHAPRNIKKAFKEGRHGHIKDFGTDFDFNERTWKSIGSCADAEKKKIDFTGKTYLAPLTTVGNLPFRRICKDYGCDITCGEMAVSRCLLQGRNAEWALTQRHVSEDIFGIQIAGGWPDELSKVTELVDQFFNVDFIDINCGCPLDLMCNHGSGCKLAKNVNRLCESVKAMKKCTDIPITCKIRTGWTKNEDEAHLLIPKVIESGASLVTLHGRSRVCRYTGLARWDYIKDCVGATGGKVPFLGNGDVFHWNDFYNNIENYGVASCMIGRGALIKPWIFEEIKEKRTIDKSSTERLDMLKTFVNYGLEHWGADKQGVANTRRFLLEWLSFLCRYIPVGIIDGSRQVMNKRPPPYFGRNELETLMASSRSDDWVKITEILLGPVPDDFNFVPKHKANAWSKVE